MVMFLAGLVVIEPTSAVLETAVLPLNDRPFINSRSHSYYTKPKGRRQYPAAEYDNRVFASLFRFFVRCVFLAPGTVFFKLQPRFNFFNIPRSPIIDAVAISAFKFN